MCKHPSQNPQRNGHTLALKRSARLSLELQGVAQKVVAIDLGVDEAGLSRYLSPDHTHCLPCDLVPAFCESVGDWGLLRTLAGRCGFQIVSAGDGPVSQEAIHALTTLLARHSGVTVGNLVQSMVDGSISDAEMSALRPDLMRLKATVDALVERMGAQ